MSLINQMLKDLEHRRSQDLETESSIIPGIKRYSVARHHKNTPWVILLASVSLVLIVVISWLLWDKMIQPEQVVSAEDEVILDQVNKESSIVKTTSTKTTAAVVKTTVNNQSVEKYNAVNEEVIKTESQPSPVVKNKVVKTI